MSDTVSILLVEDSQTQALEFQATLESRGYAVRWASSAEDAMACIEDALPDLLIVDYLLPGMRGDELSRRLRMDATTRTLPILMMTESADESVETAGLRSGIDGYVRKDEHDSVILWRIEALLRRPRVPQQLAGERAGSRTPRLLVVEDSRTWLEMIVGVLETSGYEVATAMTGTDAMEMLQEQSFDAIVTDLNLPDTNGYDLCRQVREMEGGRGDGCVLVGMTFAPESAQAARLLEYGADEVIDKERSAAVITARLEALVRRKLMVEERLRLEDEFRERELRLMHAEAERKAAEARAELADELKRKNEELQEAYAQLQRAQSELVHQAKMASLGQLVAGVAHEINNPLGFAMSHIEVVRRALAPPADGESAAASPEQLEKAGARLDSIEAGLRRISELVLNLRTFSRLDEGERKRVNLHDCIDATIRLLEHRLRDGIAVMREFEATPQLDCQPGPLNQVWMNLLSNAIDAVAGEGRIAIRTRDEGDWLVVEVEDDGAGIPTEKKSRIFEPFFTTKPQGQGTGLGLSISYGVIENHGGELAAASTPGKGSCFTVRLPRTEMQRGSSS